MTPQCAVETIPFRKKPNPWEDKAGRENGSFYLGSFAMNTSADFQMVCGNCGSLEIKIENPERALRGSIVYCSNCGVSRGTMGALKDLAVRPEAHLLPTKQRVPVSKSHSKLVTLHNELQSLRRKVQMEELRRK
jgi:hypothetical protein